MVSADAVERWVWNPVRLRLERPETIGVQIERLRAKGTRSGLAADEAAARWASAKVIAQQDRLIALVALGDPDFSLDVVRGQLGKLKVEREQLEVEVQSLVEQQRQEEAAIGELERLEEICRSLAWELGRLELALQRKLLAALDTKVTAAGRNWRLRAGIPLEGVALIEGRTEDGGVPTRPAP